MWLRAGLLALCLTTFVVGLGDSAIRDFDEAYYAEAAREMVASGDWVTPHYNFEPRLQKPVLYYWLVAGTYTLVGVTEWAARIWSALAGVGLAFLAWAAGRRWCDEATGWIAGAIVATSFGLVPIARQSLPDVPLAFFVTLATWAAIEATSLPHGPRSPGIDHAGRHRRRWLLLAGLATGLGTLTKGPVALALPALVILPLMAWQWRHSVARGREYSFPLSAADVVLAFLVFLVVALPWYVAVTQARGLGYVREFFVGENLDRFTTSRYNTWRGWDYIPVVIGGLLPWSLFGLLWIRPLREIVRGRRRLGDIDVRLLVWAGAPLVFFFVSVGSQPRYILPCLVPLAILLGRTIAAHTAAGGRPFVSATLLAGLVIVLFGVLLVRARPLLEVLDLHSSVLGPWCVVAAGVAVAASSLVLPSRFVPVAIAVGAAISLVAFEQTALVPGRPEPVEQIAAAVLKSDPGPLVCACGAFARSLNFYTHVKTEIADTDNGAEEVRRFLDNPERVLAVVDAAALAAVEQRTGRTFPRLAEVTYLNTTTWERLPFLLRPDPAEVQRVILVSNR